MSKIDTYYKLDKKVEFLWEIYFLEDDAAMEALYLSHIHALYDKISTLLSDMTEAEIRYLSLMEGESSVQ